jgi:hypothetical protein
MKKILYIMISVMLVFVLACPIVSSAEGELPEEVVPEAEISEMVETEAETEPNIFTRLYEAVTENKTDIFTILSGGILFALSLILKKDVKSVANSTISGIGKVLAKTDLTEERQNAIVEGLNGMVDSYDAIKKQSGEIVSAFSEFQAQIDEIKGSNKSLEEAIAKISDTIVKLMDTEITQNAEVMDVISSIYLNVNSLPQGVKNFVMQKRTENAKLVDEAHHRLKNETKGGESK